jgi:hypothetical protein
MAVHVVEDFLTKEECGIIVKGFSSMVTPNPYALISSTLGKPTSLEASKTSMDNPVSPLNGDADHDAASLLLTKKIYETREVVEAVCGEKDMELLQTNFVRMDVGAYNPLHSDKYQLDGSIMDEDGVPKNIEWSLLFYFSEHGLDYTGGEIEFPNQDVVVAPKKGSLIFFPGDLPHQHKVNEVLSGHRFASVFFWGKKGSATDEFLLFSKDV